MQIVSIHRATAQQFFILKFSYPLCISKKPNSEYSLVRTTPYCLRSGTKKKCSQNMCFQTELLSKYIRVNGTKS